MTYKKYYIVEESALPEVFLRVAEAKEYLESGEEKTVHAATQRVGISRSAFYKYKDTIRPYDRAKQSQLVTLQMTLRNEPGALSGVLDMMAEYGGNILSIHQSAPGGGAAAVTVGLEIDEQDADFEKLLDGLRKSSMVLRCEVLAG